MSSRRRMLEALAGREPDHIPLCFMIFAALRDGCSDMLEYAEKQVEMGLDATVELPLSPLRVLHDYLDAPGLPVRYDPRRRQRCSPRGSEIPARAGHQYCHAVSLSFISAG